MQKQSATNKSAFTLLEMIVVITLMAILATTGAMNYARYRERNILENTAEQAANLIKFAKTAAINGGSGNVTINFSPGNNPPISLTGSTSSPKAPNLKFSNGVSIDCPRGATPARSVLYTVRTGTATIDLPNVPPPQCPANTIRLNSRTYRIDITLDAQGNPTLGKPMPI